MPHLIKAQSVPFDIKTYRRQLRKAHDFLVRCGLPALRKAADLTGSANWGAKVKRVQVELPEKGRPDLIPHEVIRHNLSEVINQCATLERLIDALEWCLSEESGLSAYRGVVCHPTTSSAKRKGKSAPDNDLVLVGPDGRVARFEVSDVVGEEDGNSKEGKDLVSLGVLLRKGKKSFKSDGVVWPSDDLFLIVSEEFARRIERPTRAWLAGEPPHCMYLKRKTAGSTRIFQVCPGEARTIVGQRPGT
jgi:hypothetical protein